MLVFVPYHFSFLQDHVSATLILLSPLYWLFKNITFSYTLLIIQWCFIVFGGWATYKFVEFKTRNYTLSLLALVYYFVLYGRYSSYQCDCNLAILGASILPVFLYYFELKKTGAMLACFIFLCINREDMPLCLGFICIYLAITHRSDKRTSRLALVLSLISFVSFFLIFLFVIPAFEDENKEYRLFDYSAIGANPFEAIQFIASHPLKSLSYLFINHSGDPTNDWLKASFYIHYGLAGGLILFRRPAMLICFIPIIAKKMFNDTPFRWGYEMYYSIEIVDMLPILVFTVFSDFKSEALKLGSAVAVCVISTALTCYCIFNATNSGLGNLKYNFMTENFYKSHLNVPDVNVALAQIPDNAAVSATDYIVPHISHRDKIYHFPYIGDATYICVDRGASTYPITQEKFDLKLNELFGNKEWKIEMITGSFYLFKKIK